MKTKSQRTVCFCIFEISRTIGSSAQAKQIAFFLTCVIVHNLLLLEY